jgi:hypothetical protein
MLAVTTTTPRSAETTQLQVVNKPKRPWLIRPSAVLEIGIFFVVAILIDLVFKGDRFWSVSPHPFWIIVLLTSVQYGVKEGFLSAIVASVVLLLGNPHIPVHATEGLDSFSHLYELCINPVMWLMAALILGEMRQRHVRRQQRLTEELYESRVREETIAEKYNDIRLIKENLEFRVAGQLRTAFSAYDAARAIEVRDPNGVLDGVENLVSVLLNAERYSIFLFKNDRLELQNSFGWPADATYPREYDSSSTLYREVLTKGRVLNLVNEEDERKLDGHGVLAGSLYDVVSGRVFGMLKIESMGFSVLNFSTIESFKVLCEWVGAAYARALGYQIAKRDSMLNPDSNVLSGSFLRQQAAYLPELAKRVGFDASLISIRMVGASKIAEPARREAARALGKIISGHTRKIDQLFEESLTEQNALPHSVFTVILPNTALNNASIVVQKIQRQINLNNEPALAGVELQFNIQSLFQGQAAA